VASAWPSDTYTVGGQLGSLDYFYSEGSASYNGSIWLPYGAFPGLGEYNVYLDARDGTTQEDYDIVSIGIRLSG
jgi:hypothetical protein